MTNHETFKLSICIPTYNRWAYLRPLLTKLLNCISPNVQIVVGDGFSNDETQSQLMEISRTNLNVKYIRFESKGGIDVDLMKTISAADGTYCWLMSSDDSFNDKAVQIIIAAIEERPALLLLNRTICDAKLRQIRQDNWLAEGAQNSFHLSDKKDCLAYLGRAKSVGALFGYMSVLVINKKHWLAALSYERTKIRYYSHAHDIFAMLQTPGNRLDIIEEPLILCRFYNDSFSEEGFLSRTMIDFDGFMNIQSKFFPQKAFQEAIYRILRLEHPWYRLLRARSESTKDAWDTDIRRKLELCGYPKRELNVISLLGRWTCLVVLLTSIKKAGKWLKVLWLLSMKYASSALNSPRTGG